MQPFDSPLKFALNLWDDREDVFSIGFTTTEKLRCLRASNLFLWFTWLTKVIWANILLAKSRMLEMCSPPHRTMFDDGIMQGLPLRSAKRLSVVFDLDQTLINSSLIDIPNASFHVLAGRKNLYIELRPNLKKFMEIVQSRFDIFIFTALHKDIANQIIDHICPAVPESHRLFENNIKYEDGCTVKDLELVPSPLEDVILVDDSPGSALYQPSNAVIIQPWFGEENDDLLMGSLLPFLLSVSNDSNMGDNLRAAAKLLSPKGLAFWDPSP